MNRIPLSSGSLQHPSWHSRRCVAFRRPPAASSFRAGVGLVLATVVVLTGTAFAQGIQLVNRTLDGGGTGLVTAGIYTLAGTIGQPDAGELTARGYTLSGGFWSGITGAVVGVAADAGAGGGETAPPVFRLLPASPNPAAHSTRIEFDLPQDGPVTAAIYDLRGGLVVDRYEAGLPAGRHEFVWDLKDRSGQRVARGIYFIRVRAGNTAHQQKLVVLP